MSSLITKAAVVVVIPALSTNAHFCFGGDLA